MSGVATPISVVDFFSGCGGTSVGLQAAGMKIIAGIDNDPDAAATFSLNFPDASFFQNDVRELRAADVADVLPRTGPVLFAGCAPCQPFSRQRSGTDPLDPRRLLLGEFLRFVVALRPEHVLVENVPGLQRADSESGPFANFVSTLTAEGYSVSFGVLRALDYGVPQTRRRLVLVASRVVDVKLPNATHGDGLLPFSTVGDWISDLPPIEAGEMSKTDPDHAAMSLSALNLRRIRSTPEGGGRSDWPRELLLECHKGHSGHSDVYGRLSWERPAAGLTTKCMSYSNGRFGHPIQDRAISLREAALLQTFPRDFKLVGSLQSRARQVGNAVPPLMARSIGQAFLRASAVGEMSEC